MTGIAFDGFVVKLDSSMEILFFSGLPASIMVEVCLFCLSFMGLSMRKTNILEGGIILIAVSNWASFLEAAIRVLAMQDSFSVALDMTGINFQGSKFILMGFVDIFFVIFHHLPWGRIISRFSRLRLLAIKLKSDIVVIECFFELTHFVEASPPS